MAPKLSILKHLGVKNQDRQRVYIAVQLLSATTANAIEILFPDGCADDVKHMKELADFIRLADRRVSKSANNLILEK